MIHSVVGIYNAPGVDYEEYCPYIFTGPNTGINNTGWTPAGVYVYTSPSEGDWIPIGATQTLMIPIFDSTGNQFTTSDGKIFLVRAHN